MNIKDFNKIVKSELNKINNTLINKTKEYNLESDRLSIFKHIAQLSQTTPELALLGLVAKQITSVYEMANTKQIYPEELWDEKILDIEVYMILLKAILKERNK